MFSVPFKQPLQIMMQLLSAAMIIFKKVLTIQVFFYFIFFLNLHFPFLSALSFRCLVWTLCNDKPVCFTKNMTPALGTNQL